VLFDRIWTRKTFIYLFGGYIGWFTTSGVKKRLVCNTTKVGLKASRDF